MASSDEEFNEEWEELGDLPLVKELNPVEPDVEPQRSLKVEELTAAEVRWFYLSADNKTYQPFKGRDSLLIEVSWRVHKGMALDPEAESQVLPLVGDKVVVLDGLYQLSIKDKVLAPLFWSGECLQIVRGSWFMENMWTKPMEPKEADALEAEHLRVFRGMKNSEKSVFFDKPKKKPVFSTLKFESLGAEVVWHSVSDINMQFNSMRSKVAKYISFKFYSGAIRLHRGYANLATLEDADKPVGHLVFVVHGIGQKKNSKRIVQNTASLREVSQGLFSKYFDHSKYRAMFIPVQWRAPLALDGDLVEKTTIPHMAGLRNSLNGTALDILYYSSPRYRNEISDGFTTVLNSLYEKFVEHHPEFLKEGRNKVSLYAHSLGSVISYDVITGWSPLQLYDEFIASETEKCLDNAKEGSEVVGKIEEIRRTREKLMGLEAGLMDRIEKARARLNFPVENLFCVGSPLGCFLALRGLRGKDIELTSDRCRNIYNIYHPTDPVAYRIEPLLHETYRWLSPVMLASFNEVASKKPDYSQFELETAGNTKRDRELSAERDNERRRWNLGEDDTSEAMDQAPTDESTISKMQKTTVLRNAVPKMGDAAPDEVAKIAIDLENPEGGEKSGISDTQEPDPAKSESLQKSSSWFGLFNKKDNSPTEAAGTDSGNESKKKEAKDSKKTKKPAEVEKETLENILAEIKKDNAGLEHRLDYCTQFSVTARYFTVLRSHFYYWNHGDVIMFLLSKLFPFPSEEPAS